MGTTSKVMRLYPTPGLPLTALAAAGSKILTKEYGELTDFESGCWAAVLGHSRPEVTETIAANAGKLMHHHQFFSTEHPGALAEELAVAAGLAANYKATFLTSGSEAVSLAVALAEQLTHRKRMLSFSISYHGALPGLRFPRDPAQWLDLDIEECLACKKDADCRECGKFSTIEFTQIAAFVFEPGNSGGLVLCPPGKLVRLLAQAVTQAGGQIIVNEVTTGFGRTGKWFGFQHYGLNPHYIAMGKGLGNGYPVSCLLTREEMARGAEASQFKYLQSHTDDPLGCLVARRVVETMARERLVERGNKMGRLLRKKLRQVQENSYGIEEIRGRGLMNVMAIAKDLNAKEIFAALLSRGFFTGLSEHYNCIRLYPPLVIGEGEIEALAGCLEQILPGR